MHTGVTAIIKYHTYYASYDRLNIHSRSTGTSLKHQNSKMTIEQLVSQN